MSKRSFAFDTTSLSTAAPLLNEGFYAGVITNCAVTMGTGNNLKQTINITPEKVWDKDSKEMKETGEYIISGWMSFGVTLTSKQAIKSLQREEPKLFGGQIRLTFDQETGVMKDNHVLGQFLTALGLNEIDFNGSVDFEYNEDIEVPEELAGVTDIVTKLNSVEYHRALFTLICESANNLPVLAKVIKQPNYKSKEVMENAIDRGTTMAPFCGIMAYEDGAEEDLED